MLRQTRLRQLPPRLLWPAFCHRNHRFFATLPKIGKPDAEGELNNELKNELNGKEKDFTKPNNAAETSGLASKNRLESLYKGSEPLPESFQPLSPSDFKSQIEPRVSSRSSSQSPQENATKLRKNVNMEPKQKTKRTKREKVTTAKEAASVLAKDDSSARELKNNSDNNNNKKKNKLSKYVLSDAQSALREAEAAYFLALRARKLSPDVCSKLLDAIRSRGEEVLSQKKTTRNSHGKNGRSCVGPAVSDPLFDPRQPDRFADGTVDFSFAPLGPVVLDDDDYNEDGTEYDQRRPRKLAVAAAEEVRQQLSSRRLPPPSRQFNPPPLPRPHERLRGRYRFISLNPERLTPESRHLLLDADPSSPAVTAIAGGMHADVVTHRLEEALRQIESGDLHLRIGDLMEGANIHSHSGSERSYDSRSRDRRNQNLLFARKDRPKGAIGDIVRDQDNDDNVDGFDVDVDYDDVDVDDGHDYDDDDDDNEDIDIADGDNDGIEIALDFSDSDSDDDDLSDDANETALVRFEGEGHGTESDMDEEEIELVFGLFDNVTAISDASSLLESLRTQSWPTRDADDELRMLRRCVEELRDTMVGEGILVTPDAVRSIVQFYTLMGDAEGLRSLLAEMGAERTAHLKQSTPPKNIENLDDNDQQMRRWYSEHATSNVKSYYHALVQLAKLGDIRGAVWAMRYMRLQLQLPLDYDTTHAVMVEFVRVGNVRGAMLIRELQRILGVPLRRQTFSALLRAIAYEQRKRFKRGEPVSESVVALRLEEVWKLFREGQEYPVQNLNREHVLSEELIVALCSLGDVPAAVSFLSTLPDDWTMSARTVRVFAAAASHSNAPEDEQKRWLTAARRKTRQVNQNLLD